MIHFMTLTMEYFVFLFFQLGMDLRILSTLEKSKNRLKQIMIRPEDIPNTNKLSSYISGKMTDEKAIRTTNNSYPAPRRGW